MEFGRVDHKLLNSIDLSLPATHKQTQLILSKTKKPQKPKIYVGCAKWGRQDWVGKIYPKGTKAGNFLDEYAKQFNCIEFNAIYYRLPSHQQITAWKNKVGKDFKFCPKFSEAITHIKRLKNVEAELNAFLETIYELGDHLGPVFFMPHPQMGPKHIDIILSFLDSLPKDLEVFVEFRHQDWYKQPNADVIFSSLEKMEKGAVITDAAGRRDCVHMRLTTSSAFIRL